MARAVAEQAFSVGMEAYRARRTCGIPSWAVATRAECRRLGSRYLQGVSLCMHMAWGVQYKGVAAKAGCIRHAGDRGPFRGAMQSRCMRAAGAAGRSTWAGHARCCRPAFAWHARRMRGACAMRRGAGVLEAARLPDRATLRRSACEVVAVRGGMHALRMRNNHKAQHRGRDRARAPEQGRTRRVPAEPPGQRSQRHCVDTLPLEDRKQASGQTGGSRRQRGLARQTPGS